MHHHPWNHKMGIPQTIDTTRSSARICRLGRGMNNFKSRQSAHAKNVLWTSVFVAAACKKCRLTRHWKSGTPADRPGNLASTSDKQQLTTVNNLTTTALTGNAS